ncbi:MAG: helix-turn-helix domain-containing protein [Dehalococcoidia bacterium]
MSRERHYSERTLIRISEASQILGVSEATLRQWTDEGKIRAFVTPGGHRRYSMDGLRQFMGSRQRVHSIKDLVAELEGAASLHREIVGANFSNTSWYSRLSRESQERLGQYGRRLLDLVIRYITEPRKREETIKLAHDIGCDFGEELAKQGLSLTDSLEAFTLHRNPVVNAATHLLKGRKALDERTVEAIPLVTYIMDEALVSLVAAHQDYRSIPQTDGDGGVAQ